MMRIRTALRVQIGTTPALIMAGKVLRLSGDAVEEMIARELADNPALEVQEKKTEPHLRILEAPLSHLSRHTPAGQSLDSYELEAEPDVADRVPARETAIDQLIAQARETVDSMHLNAVIFLLQSLDERGFLSVGLEDLAHDLRTSCERLEPALRLVQALYPPGIGARDIRECLLIQCLKLQGNVPAEDEVCDNTRRILEHAWDDFFHRRDERVARTLNMAVADVEDARRFMRNHMHPYPLQLVQDTGGEVEALTYADLIVRRTTETSEASARFVIDVPAAERYALRINRQFERALRAASEQSCIEPSQRDWLDQSVERARLFMDALNHRWGALRRIGEYLVSYQSSFFEHGPGHLKSLTRAALADTLGLHESTVSRAVSDKTIQLPNGRLVPLSDLFDASLAPKEAIRQVLAGADRPLSDREISNRLRDQGIYLARRTVAKYRGQIGLSKRQRSRSCRA